MARKPSSRRRRADSARAAGADSVPHDAYAGIPSVGPAEERRDRQTGDLPGDVPQRRLERPVAAGVEVDGLEHADVACDGQRVLPDEQVLVRLEPVHRVAGPDADHALVGLDAHDRDREGPTRLRIPGGRERRFEGNHETLQPDGRDPHHGSIAEARGGRFPARLRYCDRPACPWGSLVHRHRPPARRSRRGHVVRPRAAGVPHDRRPRRDPRRRAEHAARDAAVDGLPLPAHPDRVRLRRADGGRLSTRPTAAPDRRRDGQQRGADPARRSGPADARRRGRRDGGDLAAGRA